MIWGGVKGRKTKSESGLERNTSLASAINSRKMVRMVSSHYLLPPR